MIALLLLLTSVLGLTLLGAMLGRRRRREAAEVGVSRPESAPVADDQDLLPESGKDGAQNGLAAFYAYQMAVGGVHRR